jgi:hypothetical protein
MRDELAEKEAESLLLRVREMLLAAEEQNLVAQQRRGDRVDRRGWQIPRERDPRNLRANSR